jgi:hypothetical protein
MLTRAEPAVLIMAIIADMMPAHAAGTAIRMDRQIFVERTLTDLNGRSRRVLFSAGRATPGDSLVYVLRWRNATDRIVTQPILTDAIPPGAQPDPSDPAMQVSVDGGRRWGRLDQLSLPTPLGGVRRAVPADITHIRWRIGQSISPGASGRIAFRATAR